MDNQNKQLLLKKIEAGTEKIAKDLNQGIRYAESLAQYIDANKKALKINEELKELCATSAEFDIVEAKIKELAAVHALYPELYSNNMISGDITSENNIALEIKRAKRALINQPSLKDQVVSVIKKLYPNFTEVESELYQGEELIIIFHYPSADGVLFKENTSERELDDDGMYSLVDAARKTLDHELGQLRNSLDEPYQVYITRIFNQLSLRVTLGSHPGYRY